MSGFWAERSGVERRRAHDRKCACDGPPGCRLYETALLSKLPFDSGIGRPVLASFRGEAPRILEGATGGITFEPGDVAGAVGLIGSHLAREGARKRRGDGSGVLVNVRLQECRKIAIKLYKGFARRAALNGGRAGRCCSENGGA